MVTIKNNDMPTEVKTRLTLTGGKDEYILDIQMEDLTGEIAFYEEKEPDDTTGFYFTISFEDWKEIKKFIDEQFDLDLKRQNK
jgi:hypothetical protein